MKTFNLFTIFPSSSIQMPSHGFISTHQSNGEFLSAN